MKIIKYGKNIKPKQFECKKCNSVIEYVNHEPKFSTYNGNWYLTCPVCNTNNIVGKINL